MKAKLAALERDLWKAKKGFSATADKENDNTSDRNYETHMSLQKNQEDLRGYLHQFTFALAALLEPELESGFVLKEKKQPSAKSSTAKGKAKGKTNLSESSTIFSKVQVDECELYLKGLESKVKRDKKHVEQLRRQLSQKERQLSLLKKQVGLSQQLDYLEVIRLILFLFLFLFLSLLFVIQFVIIYP